MQRTFARRRALAVVVTATIVIAVSAWAQAAPDTQTTRADPAFEVASIKPNAQGFIDLGGGMRLLRGETRCQGADTRAIPGDPLPPAGPGRCVVRNATVKEIIDVAHGLRFGPVRAVLNEKIVGGPSWTQTEAFDIDARAANTSATGEQLLAMLRTLLVERFHLAFHREPRQMTGLALLVAKDGHKLKEASPGGKPAFTAAPVVRGQSVPIGTIANLLTQRLGRPVADETGLKGVYDFTLTWTPGPADLTPGGTPVDSTQTSQSGPSLATALEEQLGLRLETRRIAVDAFVIDAIDRPTPN